VVRDVLNSPNDEVALKRVADEIDCLLVALTTQEEREHLYRAVLERLRRSRPEVAGVTRKDLLGGLAVGTIIVLATLPIVVPYLVMENAERAVRFSNLIALAQLFLLGAWWGREVGAGAMRIAAGLTLIGVVLVLVTILLGG
jgi:VIT1/CCC1 family predicted Fe2+/Mn2+ transporter